MKNKKVDNKVEEKEVVQKEHTQNLKNLSLEEINKIIQSESDKVRTKYCNKIKVLTKEKEQSINELKSHKERLKNNELRMKAIFLLVEHQLPLEFIDFVTSENEESIYERVISLRKYIDKTIKSKMNEVFRLVDLSIINK